MSETSLGDSCRRPAIAQRAPRPGTGCPSARGPGPARVGSSRRDDVARAARLSLLVAVAVAVGCVPYRPSGVDVDRPLRAQPTPGSPLAFDAAVRYAVEHNPDLLAFRSRATAVNTNPPREPVEASAGADSDHRFEASLTLDALSLLGIGRRPAELALACARRSEVWLAHHERAREIAGEIAEAFAVERALREISTPSVEIDTSAYVRAGLESGVADAAAKATKSDWAAEDAARSAERRSNRAVLARLLGLASADAIGDLADPAGDSKSPWPTVAEPAPAALIRARAEVQRAIGQFEVADRELWKAVTEQYPTIKLEPSVAADPATFFGAVRLVLPVGAASEVHARESAREAARQDVESEILDAMEEATESRARLGAAQVALSAALKRFDASRSLFRASRTRVEVASGSVMETVFAADAVLAAAKGVREASLGAARARVRAARAAGWPGQLP